MHIIVGVIGFSGLALLGYYFYILVKGDEQK